MQFTATDVCDVVFLRAKVGGAYLGVSQSENYYVFRGGTTACPTLVQTNLVGNKSLTSALNYSELAHSFSSLNNKQTNAYRLFSKNISACFHKK